MKKKIFSAVFALVVMVFVVCCSQHDEQVLSIENTSLMTKEQVVKEVIPTLQGFLNAQYDYVIGKDMNPQWNKYLLTGGDELTAHLAEHKNLLYLLNRSKYTEYTSKLGEHETTTIVQDGEKWIIDNLSDYYSLLAESEINSTPRKQQGRLPYLFVVQKVGDEWRIIDWKDYDIVFVDRWTIAPEDWPEDIYQYNDESPPITTRALKFPPPSDKPSLTRLNICAYAVKHYNNPNSAYVNFASMGGDCTNFASQCLYEKGKWSMDNTWYYYGSSNRSTSWTSASSFQTYLNNSSRVDKSCTVYEMGDLIQSLSGGVAYHTMVITGTNNDRPVVTYRSTTGGEATGIIISNLSGRQCWKIKLN